MQAEPDEEAAGGAGRRPGGAEVQRDAQRVRAAARPRLDGRHQRLRALRGAGGVVAVVCIRDSGIRTRIRRNKSKIADL